jgi:phage-related protein
MLVALFIGFVSGVVSTLVFLHIISMEKTKTQKSPYSDINLMDTKYKNCG